MSQPPGFWFKDLVNKWDDFLLKEEKKKEKMDKIKALIDGSGLMLFFKKDNKVFGSPEEGRIVYANIKNPDNEEMPEGWEKDANFAAFDLMSMLNGNPLETLFSHKDVPLINVIDRDEVEKALMQCPEPVAQPIVAQNKDGVGVINLKDKDVS